MPAESAAPNAALRKKPAMTAIAHQNIINAERSQQATARLVRLANYVFGEGFLPDVAAVAAGFPHRTAALKAARHANRPELADALRPRPTAERRAAQIEDLEFLLSVGEYPERAVTRCGLANLDSAWSLLRRWGRADLAAHLMSLVPSLEPDTEDDAA